MDQAEEDCEMVQDPFLEAGIAIPLELPYQDKVPKEEDQKENKERTPVISSDLDKNEKKCDDISLITINVTNNN